MKTNHFSTICSSLLFCVFLFMALGSIELGEIEGSQPDRKVVYHPEGDYLSTPYYEETITGTAAQGSKYQTKRKGPQDKEKRWHGIVSTRHEYFPSLEFETEYGNYVHGQKHGKFVRIFPSNVSVEMCFDMGVLVGCQEKNESNEDHPTAFQMLHDKYIWHLYNLNLMEIENTRIEELMHAIEAELARYELTEAAFDNWYNVAIDTCSRNEAFKEVINYNSLLATYESIDLIRGHDFRLAVLQHQRSPGTSTFDILTSIHPGYLNLMLQAGASEDTINIFCDNLEARMALGGALDPENPFFPDSVDQRMAMALFGMMFEEKVYPDLLVIGRNMLQSGEYHLIHSVKSILETRLNKANPVLTPQEISFLVFYTMLLESYKGDPIRKAVRDATFYGRPQLAVVTTSEPGLNQANGIELTGHVIDDGGAEVTHRGIAWGTNYNPTTDNNTLAMGSGSGKFTVTLTDLAEGQTYYARAYATNSEGTAYGNVIGFSLAQQTDISNVANQDEHFSVYPVPARGHLYVIFENLPGQTSMVSLMNMKGQQLRSRKTDLPGRHEVSFNIEDLAPGIYIVHLNRKGQSLTRSVIVE